MSTPMPPIVDFQRADKDKDVNLRTLDLAAISSTAGLSHLETGDSQVREAVEKIAEGEIKKQLRKGLRTMTETASQMLGHSVSWHRDSTK